MQKVLLLTTLIASSLLSTVVAYAGPLSASNRRRHHAELRSKLDWNNCLRHNRDTRYSTIDGTARTPQKNNPWLIDLSSLQLASSTGGTVEIAISETGLSSLGGGLIGAIGGRLGENVNSPIVPISTSRIARSGRELRWAPLPHQSDGNLRFSGQFGSSPVIGTGLLSETEIITLTAGNITTTSFDARVNHRRRCRSR